VREERADERDDHWSETLILAEVVIGLIEANEGQVGWERARAQRRTTVGQPGCGTVGGKCGGRKLLGGWAPIRTRAGCATVATLGSFDSAT